MAISESEPEAVRVSQKGQATIPQRLREKFGIDAPGEVLAYGDEGRVVIEPIPTAEELHGIHAGERERGELLATVRETERKRSGAKRRKPSGCVRTRTRKWRRTSSTPRP